MAPYTSICVTAIFNKTNFGVNLTSHSCKTILLWRMSNQLIGIEYYINQFILKNFPMLLNRFRRSFDKIYFLFAGNNYLSKGATYVPSDIIFKLS